MPRFDHLFLAKCPQCSERVDDEAFSCINCGKGEIWATFPKLEGGTFLFGCHRCGDMYSSIGLFCPRCGTRIPIDEVRRRLAQRNFMRALETGGVTIAIIILVMFVLLWWAGYGPR